MMKSIFINSNLQLTTFSKNWKRFLSWGIILLILGLAAISTANFTTLLSVVILGFVLLIGGVVITVDSFTFWWGKGSGFFLHLLMGLLYLAVGFTLIRSPILGSIPLTLFLGIFYVVIGISRLLYSSVLRTPKWGWNFLNGLLSLLLGILIIAELPSSALFIIGLFVGIDLAFCGLAYIVVALASRPGSGIISQY